jgi:hypothetical protein
MLEIMLAAKKLGTSYQNSGPGPTTAIGDSNVAYFGQVTNADLFSAAGLQAQIPELAAATFTALNDADVWFKFYYYGKFIFIKKKPMFATWPTWAKLYNAGMIYGVDGAGPYNAGTPVNQVRLVTKGPYQFKLRTITSDNTESATQTAGTSTTTGQDLSPRRSSMFTELIYRLCNDVIGSAYPESKFESFPYSDFMNGVELCREVLVNSSFPAGTILERGNIVSVAPRIAGYRIGFANITTQDAWRPVLELVMPGDVFSLQSFSLSVTGVLVGPAAHIRAPVPDAGQDPTTVQKLTSFTITSDNKSPVAGIKHVTNTVLTKVTGLLPINVNATPVAGVTATFNP